jgi:hypothetical protein
MTLLTNRQIEKQAAQPSNVFEISLAALLAGMILIRALDVFSPVPEKDLGCTPKLANRAIILCTIRDVRR